MVFFLADELRIAVSNWNESLTSLTIDVPMRRTVNEHYCDLLSSPSSLPNILNLDLTLALICPKMFHKRHRTPGAGNKGRWRVKTRPNGCMDWMVHLLDAAAAASSTSDIHNEPNSTDLIGEYYHPPRLHEMGEVVRGAFPSDGSWDVELVFEWSRATRKPRLCYSVHTRAHFL